MAAEDKKESSKAQRIADSERFLYIGFEVFPGRPKDLFGSDSERQKYVDAVKTKREKGEVIREECTLMEERISTADRIVIAIACVVLFASLFLPWYSAYNDVVQESNVAATTTPATTTPAVVSTSNTPNEQVIHGYVAKKKVFKDYSRVSGFGAFISIGSLASFAFGSGFAAGLVSLLLIVLMLSALGLPAYTLYGLYGLKGSADEKALELKKILRLNWLPLLLFVAVVVLSFLGGDYGFDAGKYYQSLGDAFGPIALFETLSWGVFVAVAMSILVAVKGVEI